jgi:nicotinamide-nucleotide amidase
MTRNTISLNKIAILATGDEISNGDILNTNAQEIARKLFDNGMHVGTHMVAPDKIADIEEAILFLLQTHSALIITGGLGPTSDDLTRYALANAVKRPLVFDEACWENIVKRLKHFGYHTPPASNRQQALFPETATLIPNPNGTAAGCTLLHNKQMIFMLPGPPAECLPMFNEVVLPALKTAGFSQVEYHKNWLLFGVSEGQIAEELDILAKPYDCITGYRLFYPYIEFKLHSNNSNDFAALVPQIEKTIQPFLIHDGQFTASKIVREKLEKLNFILTICDYATGGALEVAINTPSTHKNINFTNNPNTTQHITIKGLDEFWQNAGGTQTNLHIHFNLDNRQETIDVKIPFRGQHVKLYAAEFVCSKLYQFLERYQI